MRQFQAIFNSIDGVCDTGSTIFEQFSKNTLLVWFKTGKVMRMIP